jgi:quercetin dioxygenase-like cupin family protein
MTTREHRRRAIMAKAGEVLYTPVLKDRIVYRKTARDTDGELLRLELFVSPRGGNPLHVHPLQEEYFKAVSGTMGVQVGDEHRQLREGEEATVPPGTPHRWFNDSEDEEAHVLAELRPALNSETFFETAYGLARDGKTDETGAYNLLQQAVTLTGINRGEIYLASPSVAVQRVLLAALAPMGRLLGYKDHYPRYSAEDGKGG